MTSLMLNQHKHPYGAIQQFDIIGMMEISTHAYHRNTLA